MIIILLKFYFLTMGDKKIMKVFVIDRMDRYSYCDNYKAVVVAEDALHAEKYARMNVYGFKKAKLKVTEISLDTEQILSVENVGA